MESVLLCRDDEDYDHLQKSFYLAAWKTGCRVIAEIAMSNHGHAAVLAPTLEKAQNAGEMIKKRHSQYLSWKYNEKGILNRSDILISDFSGVIFDFALLHDKPVICASADEGWDPAPYDIWWLDIPLWTQTVVPRIGPTLTRENMPELKRMIDDCLTGGLYRAERGLLRAEAWTHPGEGAKNIADYLIGKYSELTQSET